MYIHESESMKMIRKIRDENSARHAKMSFEEQKKEEQEFLKRFEKQLGRPLNLRPQ